MAFIDKANKVCFVHIPKNAGTSIQSTLYNSGSVNELDVFGSRLAAKSLRLVQNSMRLSIGFRGLGLFNLRALNDAYVSHINLSEILINYALDGFLVFAVVRDPLDWLCSQYRYISSLSWHPFHGKPFMLSLESFLIWRCSSGFQSQYSFLHPFSLVVLPCRVHLLDFANIQEDWSEMLDQYSLPYERSLKYLNSDPSVKGVRSVCSSELPSSLVKRVYTAYRSDLSLVPRS